MKKLQVFVILFSIVSSTIFGQGVQVAIDRKIVPFYQITLVDSRWPDRPFVVKVDPTNIDGIKSLEKYLPNLKEKVQGAIKIVNIGLPIGKVLKVSPSKTHAWSFEIDPKSVIFQDFAIEVCDASFMYIEKDVDKWIEEVGEYCPWGAGYNFHSVHKSWIR